MSCYICNDLTTEAAARALISDPNSGYANWHLLSLVNELRQLNTDAYNFRYQEHEESDIPTVTGIVFADAEMLSASKCLVYQCNEGDQFSSHPLYIALERWIDQTQQRGIVSNGWELYEKDFSSRFSA